RPRQPAVDGSSAIRPRRRPQFAAAVRRQRPCAARAERVARRAQRQRVRRLAGARSRHHRRPRAYRDHLMRGKTVIAGIGHTASGKLPGRDTLSLNVEACRKALEDAGIEKDAVDGLFVKFPTSSFSMMYGQTLAEALRLQPRVGGVWDQGGASNISMISFAAMAIEHGQCEIAIVCGADNPRTGTRQAYEKAWGDDAAYGWFGVPAGYAMLAQRHMQQFGTRPEQMAAVAIACRRHGAENPDAQLRKPLTLDEYFESPMIVEPLRRADCCLIS